VSLPLIHRELPLNRAIKITKLTRLRKDGRNKPDVLKIFCLQNKMKMRIKKINLLLLKLFFQF
jgi:hypothetical protein